MSVLGTNISEMKTVLSLLYLVLIYGIFILLQVHQFWDSIRGELDNKSLYNISIGGIKMRLSELQDNDKETKKLRSAELLPEGYKDIKEVLHYQGLSYVPKVICAQLISRHHDNFLVSHFKIKKTRANSQKILLVDATKYVKGCDVQLVSKVIHYKPYRNL